MKKWRCENGQLTWYDHNGIGVTQRDPNHKIKSCVLQCSAKEKNNLIYFESDKQTTIALQTQQSCDNEQSE